MANKKKKAAPISARRRKQINLLISYKARLRATEKSVDKLKADPRTLVEKRSEMNFLIHKGAQLNNQIIKTSKKTGGLRKDKLRGVKVNEDNFILRFRIWEKSSAENYILKEVSVNKLNGIDMKKNTETAVDLLNNIFAKKMESKDELIFQLDDDNNATLSIDGIEKNTDSDIDFNED